MTIKFRNKALQSMNGIQPLQRCLRVVETGATVYLLAALLAVIGIMLYGVYGEINLEVSGHGILLPANELEKIEQQNHEAFREREMVVHDLKDLAEKKRLLFNKHLLTRDELEKAKQDYLTAKDNLSIAKPGSSPPRDLFANSTQNSSLTALIFVSHAEGKKIATGMSAYVLPTYLSSYDYGYIKGRVSRVSVYPAARESVYAYLGNMNLVDEYFAGGAPFVVQIVFEHTVSTKSKLQWTTSKGAPYVITAGNTVSAKIIYQQYHPYELLLTARFG